jgi:hypothetical protein
MTRRSQSMRLVVYDIGNPSNRVVLDASAWRALLQHLVDCGLERSAANRLVWYLGGRRTSVGPAWSMKIAGLVRQLLLPGVPQGSSLTLPATHVRFDHTADDTAVFIPESQAAAVVSRVWLEEFAELCSVCSGISVRAEGTAPPPRSGGAV